MSLTAVANPVLSFGGKSIAAVAAPSLTADFGQEIDVTVPANQTDMQVNVTIDVSALVAIALVASAAMTIETNSAGSPVDTLTLSADKPMLWYSGCGLPNPFASGTDVTKFFVTNTTAGTLKGYVLQDGTP